MIRPRVQATVASGASPRPRGSPPAHDLDSDHVAIGIDDRRRRQRTASRGRRELIRASGQQWAVDARSDADVIAGSLDDRRLFAVLFDRHAGVLFRFLIRRVGRDTADELLGETFRIAFEKRSSFDGRQPSAKPWLYGIATNLVAKHRRTEARRLRATGRLVGAVPAEPLADAVVAAVDARELWPAVAAGIGQLPDGERDALLLYVWEDLSYDDIAVALQIPVGTVRSRLSRARGRLRELAAPDGEQQVTTPAVPSLDQARIQP